MRLPLGQATPLSKEGVVELECDSIAIGLAGIGEQVMRPDHDGAIVDLLGRLLIILYLSAQKVLPTPLLYLSAYFEQNRGQYYDQLLALSSTGDWETWLAYFLRGVYEQATDALERTRRIRELRDRYHALLTDRHESANALRVVDELFAAPYMTAPRVARLLGVTNPGARGILDRLVQAGILRFLPETWPRLYVAAELLETVEDTPPEPAHDI